MFLTLTAGGLIEGFMSLQLVPRSTILEIMQPFWLVRTLSGVSIIVGFSCLVTNMILTARGTRIAHVDMDYGPFEQVDDQEVALGAV